MCLQPVMWIVIVNCITIYIILRLLLLLNLQSEVTNNFFKNRIFANNLEKLQMQVYVDSMILQCASSPGILSDQLRFDGTDSYAGCIT